MRDMALYMTPVIRNTATRGHNITKKKKKHNYGLFWPGRTFFNLLFVVVSHRRAPWRLYDVNLTKHNSHCPRLIHRLDGHIILSIDGEREGLGEQGTHCVRPLMNLEFQFKLLGSGAAIVLIKYPAITWGDSFASDSRLVYVFGILNNQSIKERILNVHQSWMNLNRREKAFKDKNEHNGDNRMLDWITGAKCQHWQKNNKQQNALLFSHWCSVVLSWDVRIRDFWSPLF